MLGLGNSITSVSPKVETAMTSAIQYNFDGATDQTFAGDPHGFTKATNSMAAFSGGGSLVAYHGMGSNANTHGWVNGAAATGSSATGPTGGHGGGFDTLGDPDTSSSEFYLVYEASSASGASNLYKSAHQGGDGGIRAIRSVELDFSGYQDLELTMFAHLHGDNIATNVSGSLTGTGIGIAFTTSATSSGGADEAATGFGFTSRTAGGITFNVMQDNSLTSTDSTHTNTVRLGSAGEIQANTSDKYRYVTSDISAIAGLSSVYMWIAYFSTPNAHSGNFFKQDVALDNIHIRGNKEI
jgi:hypothetical protein|tara:strand:- start:406 stop:1296 length:891 start_codon:yes stop_codon:yes gene_type:complete